MKFGDKQWFEAVEEKCKFPSDFAFYVDTSGEVSSTCLGTNLPRIGNMKYRDLNRWDDQALIKVTNCKSSRHYYETVKQLKKRWNH